MRFLSAVWENVYGLLVDDGSIALGTIIALPVAGGWSWATAQNLGLSQLAGPLLFVLLMGLLVGNLYRTGQAAARKLAKAR